jgi:SAM-dependent methyltransferase
LEIVEVGIDDDGRYGVVVGADVLEHVCEPERLLEEIRAVLVPRGVLIASVPNFGHWYSRGRTALGLFDYDQRVILDRGHVRFFTRRSFLRRLRQAGFTVVRHQATGLPLEVLSQGENSALKRAIRGADRLLVGVRPTLFGYQFVAQCETPALAVETTQPSPALRGQRTAVESLPHREC